MIRHNRLLVEFGSNRVLQHASFPDEMKTDMIDMLSGSKLHNQDILMTSIRVNTKMDKLMLEVTSSFKFANSKIGMNSDQVRRRINLIKLRESVMLISSVKLHHFLNLKQLSIY